MDNLSKSFYAADSFSTLKLDDHTVRFVSSALEGALIAYDSRTPDFKKQKVRFTWNDVSGKNEFVARKGYANLLLMVPTEDGFFTRRLEILSEVVPLYGKPESNRTQ